MSSYLATAYKNIGEKLRIIKTPSRLGDETQRTEHSRNESTPPCLATFRRNPYIFKLFWAELSLQSL